MGDNAEIKDRPRYQINVRIQDRNGVVSQKSYDIKRPMVITQHGKSAAVLLDLGEYEAMQEKLELLQDIQTAVNQIENGREFRYKV